LSIFGADNLWVELQGIDEIIAQPGLFLLDVERRSFLRKPAQEAKQRPAERRQKDDGGENAVSERRIRKEILELIDTGAEREKQQSADRR